MKKQTETRKYHMADPALAQFCDKVVILVNRDAEEFLAFNYAQTDLNKFSAKITGFKNFDSDEFFEGVRMEMTEQKYTRRNELIEAISPVRDRIRLVFGELSAVYRSLRITDITNMPDENLVFTAKRSLSIGTAKKTQLQNKGLTEGMLTALSSALQNFDLAIDAVEDSNVNRDEQTEARMSLGNELYAEAVSLCEIGKSIWYSRSEARYNDYVIYTPAIGKSILTGKVTDQANGNPIAGAVVELSEVDVTEETDEQGNYIFADIKPDTYTLTVSADEFIELTKEGIVLHKGETVTVNVGMVGV